jgi:hypothetical protein
MPLEEIEEAFKEAILTGGTKDRLINDYLNIITSSMRTGRPLFPNLLDEPVLYTMIYEWVQEAIQAQARITTQQEALTPELANLSRLLRRG